MEFFVIAFFIIVKNEKPGTTNRGGLSYDASVLY